MKTAAAESLDDVLKRIDPKVVGLPKTQIGIPPVDKFTKRGMEIFLMHYGNNLTHGPKDELAFAVADYCHKEGINVMLELNPVRDKRKSSLGSYIDALHTAASFYRGMVVVEFTRSDKKDADGRVAPYVSVQRLAGRKRLVSVHLDMDREHYTSQRLEQIFNSCLTGQGAKDDDYLNNFYHSKDAGRLRKFIKGQLKVTLRCKDVTNPDEFIRASEAYHYKGEVFDQMKKMDVIIASGGTFTRIKGMIEKLGPTYIGEDKVGPSYVIVTSPDNSAALERYFGSIQPGNRLGDGRFMDKEGKLILNSDKQQVISGYAFEPRYDLRVIIAEKEDFKHASEIAKQIKCKVAGLDNMHISDTGMVTLCASTDKYAASYNYPFTDEGISLKTFAYEWQKDGPNLKEFPFIVGPGQKVCFVTTGASDLTYVKQRAA
ncbi:MAG TPA: hypothetical protein VFF28_03225 [Candidatus Nanoarchaeia archaeon]|nr:hypothetical protein [Candidatus Nanoarchaeia archaeon]